MSAAVAMPSHQPALPEQQVAWGAERYRLAAAAAEIALCRTIELLRTFDAQEAAALQAARAEIVRAIAACDAVLARVGARS